MKTSFKKSITLLTIFCTLFILMTSCSGASAEVSISDVTMTSKVDEQTFAALEPTEEFETKTSEIHVVATISNSTPQKTQITTEWYYLDQYTLIDSATITAVSVTGPVWFSITKPENDWLAGDYKVVFLIDSNEAYTKTFKVKDELGNIKISNVNISSKIDPNTYEALEISDVFDYDTEEIYVTGVISNAIVGETEIMTEWYHVDESIFIDSTFVTADKQEGIFWFSLEKDSEFGWIEGKYQVAIFVDDEQMDLRYFEVLPGENIPRLSDITTTSKVDENTFEALMPTDTFSNTTSEIHVVANYDKCIADKTQITADWDYIDEGIYMNTTEIITVEENGTIWFSLLKPEDNWPEGKYKISFYIDGKSAGQTFYEVLDGGFSPSLSNITTANNVDEYTYEALDKTSVFNVNSPKVHVVADIDYAIPNQTEVKTEWYYETENIFIGDTTVTAFYEQDTVWFTLGQPDGGWPVGKYKIKFFIDDVEASDITFDVK